MGKPPRFFRVGRNDPSHFSSVGAKTMKNKQTIDGVQRKLIEKAMLACFEAGHGITHDELRALLDKPECIKCCDTGEADSGGVHPWGEAINIPCDCVLVTQPQGEVERLRAELQELRDSMSFRTSLIGETITERDTLRIKLAEQDALLRSTSIRLHNAHHKMDRLMEISPIHKVKLLTDAMHHVAYAHKCIDMPAISNSAEPKQKPQD